MNKTIRVALIRGAFLNPNELQNYAFLKRNVKIQSFSSHFPLGEHPRIHNVKLASLFDLSSNGFFRKLVKIVSNRLLGDPHWLFGLERRLNRFQIIDTADPYYYYSYQAAKYVRKHPETKLVVTYCETIAHNNESTLAKRRIKKYVLNEADLFVCHTRRSERALLDEGVNRHKIKLVPLGVDITRFSPGKNKTLTVLFVGRLVPEKGIWQLWQVYQNLRHHFPKLRLQIVGQGPLAKKLKSVGADVTESGYNRIHKLYQQADILIMPSYHTPTWEEQYGMVLVEAMSSGLAIVATRCGAISEVLGDAGILIEEKDIGALENNLRKLLTDQELRQSLGQKARRRAKSHFHAKQFADKMNIIYEELIRRPDRT